MSTEWEPHSEQKSASSSPGFRGKRWKVKEVGFSVRSKGPMGPKYQKLPGHGWRFVSADWPWGEFASMGLVKAKAQEKDHKV